MLIMPDVSPNHYETAHRLFNRLVLRSRLRRWWGRMSGVPCELKFLGNVTAPADEQIRTGVEKTVPLSQIIGTAGRADRFDCQFRPKQMRDRGRWTALAVAIMENPMAMERVELVQVGDDYYVVDGNHRISIAHALGKISFDAIVTVWQFDVPSADEG